jgi:3-hexulose-6-phosphate synthase
VKLQVALDYMDLQRALTVARAVAPYVDWIEAGTSLIKLEGISAVRALADAFPSHTIVADMKIADGGKREVDMAYTARAEVTTVLGLMPDKAVTDCLSAAQEAGRTIFVDLLGTGPERWEQLHRLGATHVIYHIGKHEQGERTLNLKTVTRIKERFGFTVAAAGGLTVERLSSLKAGGPDVLIVGSGITGAANPVAMARAFREAMEG